MRTYFIHGAFQGAHKNPKTQKHIVYECVQSRGTRGATLNDVCVVTGLNRNNIAFYLNAMLKSGELGTSPKATTPPPDANKTASPSSNESAGSLDGKLILALVALEDALKFKARELRLKTGVIPADLDAAFVKYAKMKTMAIRGLDESGGPLSNEMKNEARVALRMATLELVKAVL